MANFTGKNLLNKLLGRVWTAVDSTQPEGKKRAADSRISNECSLMIEITGFGH